MGGELVRKLGKMLGKMLLGEMLGGKLRKMR